MSGHKRILFICLVSGLGVWRTSGHTAGSVFGLTCIDESGLLFLLKDMMWTMCVGHCHVSTLSWCCGSRSVFEVMQHEGFLYSHWALQVRRSMRPSYSWGMEDCLGGLTPCCFKRTCDPCRISCVIANPIYVLFCFWERGGVRMAKGLLEPSPKMMGRREGPSEFDKKRKEKIWEGGREGDFCIALLRVEKTRVDHLSMDKVELGSQSWTCA